MALLGTGALALSVGLAIAALPWYRQHRGLRDAREAREAFGYVAARARASAVERRRDVVLVVRAASDSVLVVGFAGETLEVLDYRGGRIRSDLVVSPPAAGVARVCYEPRGFARPSCGGGDRLPVRVGFASGGDTIWSAITEAGQVQRQEGK